MKRNYEYYSNVFESEPNDQSLSKKTNHNESIENIKIYSVDNEIHFSDGINKISIQYVIREIQKIIDTHKKKNKDKKLVITYTIDSPGGSVLSVLKFVDFINIVKKKYKFVEFVSVITGLAASAGTIMALSADTRKMTKNAYAMIHELSSGNSGQYSHLASHMIFLNQLHENLLSFYIDATGKTKEEFENWLIKEKWCSAKEYKEMGLISEII